MFEGDFHLISFQTPAFTMPLFTNDKADKGAKASVVIGPNGSGKSQALAAISNQLTNIHRIFRRKTQAADELKISKRLSILKAQEEFQFEEKKIQTGSTIDREFDARITYALDGDIWNVTRYGRELEILRNNELADIEELRFADRVLALAHLPLDKFRFAERADEQFYRYLGLRQSNNMTTTGALSTQTLLSFLEALDEPTRFGLRDNWLTKLGLEAPFYVGLQFQTRRILAANSEAGFVELSREYLERRVGSSRARAASQDEDIEKDLSELWPFIRELQSILIEGKKIGAKLRDYLFPVHFPEPTIATSYGEIARLLRLGRKLRLFGQVALHFTKNLEIIAFDDLSSGEQHVLSTTSQLLANLGKRTVVLIDEPEISLHPDWQRQYIPSLLKTLSEYPQTHAIIATHSHFLVSDVEEATGSLTVANSNTGHFEAYDGEVFGRSADNILYRVFGLGSAGNRFVEYDLAIALKMISGSEEVDLKTLREINNRLQPLASRDNIALNEILTSIQVFLAKQADA